MKLKPEVLAVALLVSLLSAALTTSQARAAPRGPAFGNNRYSTSIRSAGGSEDVDDFVAPLIRGERLIVSVVATRRSRLRPKVQLVAPDGELLSPALRSRRRGRVVSLVFPVDATGPWAVRVSGDGGTEGAYTASFRVRNAPPTRLRGLALDAAGTASRTHEIEALEEALLQLTVSWRRRSAAVQVRAVDDPDGDPVPGAVEAVVAGRRRARLPRHPLGAGDGTYSVDVGVDSGSAVYSLVARVVPQGRPRGRRATRLTADEPAIVASGGTIRGIAGRPVPIPGVNLGDPARDVDPVVYFGDVAGTDVAVSQGGGRITVTPPPGEEGSTVTLTVVNPDGQATTLANGFLYAPPPVVSAVIDAAGAPLLGGPTFGGQSVRLVGTGLVAEHTVLFGTLPGMVVLSSGTTELSVATPASPVGTVSVSVVDEFGRAGVAPTTFTFKEAPAFAADPYDPPLVRPGEAVEVTISGTAFEAVDELLMDGVVTASTFFDATRRTLSLGPLPPGSHTIALRDSIGTVVTGPVFVVKGPATISGVAGVAGSYAPPAEVPLLGGATVEVTGTGFHPGDTVTLGGATVSVTDRTATSFRFAPPPGAPGSRTLQIVDRIGQSVTRDAAVVYVGFEDATATRSPGKSATDDLTALRGVIGDLDADGLDDDLVLVSYDYYRGNVYRGPRTGGSGVTNPPGTRAEYTRILFGGSTGTFTDRTASNFPTVTGGNYPDNWNALAVAIGDLDGNAGNEIVIGGVGPYYPLYNDVRIFANDGAGTFTLETANPLPPTYLPPLFAYDQGGVQHRVYGPRYVSGVPTSIAIGDIDGDSDLDVVVGREFYDSTYLYVDYKKVDFTQSPPYVSAANAAAYQLNRIDYYSATQVFRNKSDGWADATDASMPFVGDSTLAPLPAFHAEDIALGDIDRDGDLDLVVTWPDPPTVSPFGRYSGTGTATVATRVLTATVTTASDPEDNTVVFSDVTATWLPPALGNEFWQAHRLALADLDGDGDLDLVLLLHDSIDAYAGTPTYGRHALRVLRNDGAVTGFTDVTATVLPALPGDSNDNLRGDSLRAADVNGDGHTDLLVGTRQTITSTGGTRLRSTRLLLGTAAFRFVLASDFLPAATTDSGEAEDLLVGDLEGGDDPVLLLLTEKSPAVSPAAENLRVFDWKR